MTIVLLIAFFAVGGVIATTVAVRRVQTAAELDAVGRDARRRSVLATAATLVGGLGTLWVWSWVDVMTVSVRYATMPALAGTVVVLAALVAERTWPRPQGTLRRAALAPRPLSGTALQRPFWASTAVTAAVLVAGAFTADPSGRAVERTWPDHATSAGPYPGLAYGVPVGIACLLLIAVTLVSLQAVTNRPSLGPDHLEADAALRAASRVRVLRGAVFGMAATAAGLCSFAGLALHNVTGESAPPAPALAAVAAALAVMGVAWAMVALTAAIWPAPRILPESTNGQAPARVTAAPVP